MDKFDLKKYIAEGKLLKEDTSKYEPFVKGETTLIRSEIYEERRDLGYTLENQEEYDFLLKYGPDAFQSEYANGEIDAFVKDYRYNEREEFSLGNDFNSYNLTPIQEDQSANQLKEDTSKYEPFVEGKTFLRRTEFKNNSIDYSVLLDNKEQYDYLTTNGISAFFNKYPDMVDEFDFEDEYSEDGDIKYSIGSNSDDPDLPKISENKSTK